MKFNKTGWLKCTTCLVRNKDIGLDACNLSCGHCKQKTLVKATQKEIDAEFRDDIINVVLLGCLIGAVAFSSFGWIIMGMGCLIAILFVFLITRDL
jgi:hypothetical protein